MLYEYATNTAGAGLHDILPACYVSYAPQWLFVPVFARPTLLVVRAECAAAIRPCCGLLAAASGVQNTCCRRRFKIAQ